MIYYVDYENVSNAGIAGIDALDANDIVHIVYSKNAHSMHMDYVAKLRKSKASINFVKLPESKNGKTIKDAMDFFIIGLLFSSGNKEDNTYIVSGDNGYDFAIAAGQRNGYNNIKRITSINKSLADKPTIPKNETEMRKILAECLKDMLDFKQIELCGTEIIEMLKTISGKQAKSQFYNAIIRKWKRESGLPIYHKISPHFNELRELTKNE